MDLKHLSFFLILIEKRRLVLKWEGLDQNPIHPFSKNRINTISYSISSLACFFCEHMLRESSHADRRQRSAVKDPWSRGFACIFAATIEVGDLHVLENAHNNLSIASSIPPSICLSRHQTVVDPVATLTATSGSC